MIKGLVDRIFYRGSRPTLLRAAAAWDRQYARGKWARISSPDEALRFRAVAATLHERRVGSVLDVGCGVGALKNYWNAPRGARYLGIDLSSLAITEARGAHPEAHFEVAEFNSWSSPDTFDAIVFGESLYHAPSPRETLVKLADRLTANGIFVVSVFDHFSLRGVWQEIDAHFETVNHETLRDTAGRAWDLRVLRQANRA